MRRNICVCEPWNDAHFFIMYCLTYSCYRLQQSNFKRYYKVNRKLFLHNDRILML